MPIEPEAGEAFEGVEGADFGPVVNGEIAGKGGGGGGRVGDMPGIKGGGGGISEAGTLGNENGEPAQILAADREQIRDLAWQRLFAGLEEGGRVGES